MPNTQAKKLIEVALPLPEINDASAYDKMPGIGPHPKGIHHWWARLPLPTARAVLFASVVDDPSEHPERFPTEEAQNAERERLFEILRSMMAKRLHERPEVYAAARAEMLKHCGGNLPAVYDPFAGGGSIPLEAHRLGFAVKAGDLNPVAILINKVLLEVGPRWAGHPPINPTARANALLENAWHGASGLAEDVRYYSRLIEGRARHVLTSLYPLGPDNQHAVAWLWCRTVASPNPACGGAHVPLIRSFCIAKKKTGTVWLTPVVSRQRNEWRFRISDEKPSMTATVGRKGATCILTKTPIPLEYVRAEGRAGRLGLHLTAVVADGRQYYDAVTWPMTSDVPATDMVIADTMPHNPFAVRPPIYGLTTFADVFTRRQLYSLRTLSNLVVDARAEVAKDAAAVLGDEEASAYADAIATYLAFILDRCVDFNNSLCRWSSSNQKVMSTFGRQAIPMIWDFAEANILAGSVGGWRTCSDYVCECIEVAFTRLDTPPAVVAHGDAVELVTEVERALVSTDPPYYNNIDYSDLSDFFYVWLRRSLAAVYPELFRTVLTPKSRELVASPYRFDGDRQAARDHFEGGFRDVFGSLRVRLDDRFPMTVYYAFKQSDEEEGEADDSDATNSSTGWETMLEALAGSGFQISGTWPVRASQQWRQMSMGMNALASYIVLACRPRPNDAPIATRKDVINLLRSELPEALKRLQHGNIAPVDLAQSAIGPGMAVFTRYAKVIESDGSPMTVRTALGIINQVLDEVLAEQEGDFDADTRWALAWFEQHGMDDGPFGVAETLSKAKNTAVNALVEAGIVKSKAGKVRLLRRDELPDGWDPATDPRLRHWEVVQYLIRTLDTKGETEAAKLLNRLGGMGETARELAYRLYSICERKKWADEALAYNSLVLAWPELTRLAHSGRIREPVSQEELF